MERSYLFVPATNPKMIEKAVMSEADCIILDLEDAVADSEKESSREEVKKAIQSYRDQKPIYVRVNGVTSPYWKQDVAAIMESDAAGIVVPKVDTEDDIKQILNLTGGTIPIIAQIESGLGIQFAYEIAKADRSVKKLAFGSLDFAWDIGCELAEDGTELLYARSQLVIVSRAAGIGSPIDTVYPDFNDAAGLERESQAVKRLGFKAKLIIHPKQIDVVNRVFSPSTAEITWAKRIVEEFEQTQTAVIQVDGKMVDYPVYKKAKDLIGE